MPKDIDHYLVWDENKINKFWNFVSTFESYQNDYFSLQVGKGIIKFLRYITPLEGIVLDYGCGPGYLLDILVSNKIDCNGVDFSEESVNLVNSRYKNNRYYKGSKIIKNNIPFEDNTFDLIICLETLEHINKDKLNLLLDEFHRVLKKESGFLFITVPNNEDLGKSMAYCPECGSIFHRYQHINSFNIKSLSGLLDAHNFRASICNITNFELFQRSIKKKSGRLDLRYIKGLPLIFLLSLFDLILNRRNGGYVFNHYLGKGPHLFWIGKKINMD